MVDNLNPLPELKILYEDNHLIAVFKPANLLTQGDRSGDISLLDLTRSWIKHRYQKPGNVFLGLLHRLDRPVCGVVLFAKTSKAAARLSEQFRARSLTKEYLALVEGVLNPGRATLKHFLERQENRTVAFREFGPGRAEALLEYEVLTHNGKYSFLRINLGTGRKHQIRAQLSSMGHPIVGDQRYGGQDTFGESEIGLIAKRLSFYHPVRTSDQITVEVPPEADPVLARGINLGLERSFEF